VSKKSFSDGLESLFSSSHREEKLETIARPKRKGTATEKQRKQSLASPDETSDLLPDPAVKKSTSKTFALDLDAFLQDVLNESISEELAREQPQELRPPDRKEGHAGIDALIRSTLETSQMEINAGKSKRVTFFFDERKVDKLKEIAKQENLYMREVISRIVAEYLAKMEKEA
jgi:hypothetical protein